jgi:hypothetical protein
VVLQPADVVVVGSQEDQPVLLEARLLAAVLEDRGCAVDGQALPALAEGRIRRQNHQSQRQSSGTSPLSVKTWMPPNTPLANPLVHALAHGGEYILLILEAALALFHLAAQVGPRVEPESVVGVIQVMQPVTEPAQRVLVDSRLLARLNHAEEHTLQLQPRTSWLAVLGALPRKMARAARRHAWTLPKRVSLFSMSVVSARSPSTSRSTTGSQPCGR